MSEVLVLSEEGTIIEDSVDSATGISFDLTDHIGKYVSIVCRTEPGIFAFAVAGTANASTLADTDTSGAFSTVAGQDADAGAAGVPRIVPPGFPVLMVKAQSTTIPKLKITITSEKAAY